MKVELKVPEFGEWVQEVQIAKWLRREGDLVQRDEDLVELETDKATMELAAPAAGIVTQIVKSAGQIAKIGDVIAIIDDAAPAATPAKAAEKPAAPAEEKPAAPAKIAPALPPAAPAEEKPAAPAKIAPALPPAAPAEEKPAAPAKIAPALPPPATPEKTPAEPEVVSVHATPAARRELRKHGLEPEQVSNGGKRVERQDVLRYVAEHAHQEPAAAKAPSPASAAKDDNVKLVPMSLIRRRIAERLVAAQQQAALLTTFNEVDMSAVIETRGRVGESFKARHGVKLGFMSFFVKASIAALREFPELNAEIRGHDIAYFQHCDIGIAIGSERGLVVPVLKHAEEKSFAQVEQAIADFAKRAGEGKLLPDELQGGTFTISNGGVYGSLLSTPIVNPPQSGVLGMHSIEERPVARAGQVVIRPMMYIALTYDHRIIDGRGAVGFLKRIKEVVEDPSRLLYDT